MDAPVLSCRWTKDGTKIVAAGADKTAKLFDIQSQQTHVVGQHDAPIKVVRWFEENARILITGSWDKTIKYWDLRSPSAVGTVHLGERVYTMDTLGPYLMCGLADRKIQVMHLSNPNVIYKSMESPLKWQIRVIQCFLTPGSMAIGSLDGRIAIHNVEENAKQNNFTFKCHRDDACPQNVYSVNDVAVHPKYGTFGTCGSDGVIHFWDKEARTRLKTFQHAGKGVPIPCISFNRTGTMLAYAVSYDWSRGHEHYNLGAPNLIKIHLVNDADIRNRSKKS
ncbi:hypothetical protein HMI56_003717 [Coelomomyces lativittatus]|nr:hypothetical protein HMI56_003717 [Coelomomyces lativittatus]